MPVYILLSKLTPEGRKRLHEQPERLEEVNDEMRRMNVVVRSQFAVLGPYDFVTTVEAPDNETVAHLAVDLGSRGTVEIMSMPAVPIADFMAKLHGPEQLGKGPVAPA